MDVRDPWGTFPGRVGGEPIHFQEGGAFPWLTVRDNVGFGLGKRSRSERNLVAVLYVGMVELLGFEWAYRREISVGMWRRVEIARALAADPEVPSMDEPFGALEDSTGIRMRADLVQIWEAERNTVLFVSHDIDEATQVADRVVVMGRRPAAIRADVADDLSRPRDVHAPGDLDARDRIFTAMGMNPAPGVEFGPGPAA